MKGLIWASALALVMTACGNSGITQTTINDSTAVAANPADKGVSRDTLRIHFSDLDVLVVGLELANDGVVGTKEVACNSDTFVMELDMSLSLENAHLFATAQGSRTPIALSIKEARTHVLSIQDEGPHLDLFEWNPFTTEYTSLEPIGEHRYHPKPIDYEGLEFGLINYETLIAHVDSLEGLSEWADLLRNMNPEERKSMKVHYPLSVGVGYHWFRLEGEIRGQIFRRWVQFVLPQGC